MRSFAKKPEANQQTTSAKSTEPTRTHQGKNADVNPALHLQRTIGNQGVQRLLQGNTADSKGSSTTSEAARIHHDSSQHPKHSPAGRVAETTLAVAKPHHEHGKQDSAAENMGSALTSSTGPMVNLPSSGMVHPVAASLAQPGVRFRVPKYDKLLAAYTDKDLKIPEAIIKARVTQLLERMEKEKRLKSKESVAAIIAKIFPSAGKIDKAEFEKAVDVTDRTKIYESVAEANTKVKAADKPKLQTAMKDSATLVRKVMGNASGLKEVFGTKDAAAKAIYDKTAKVLDDLPSKLDVHVTTDYNLDDPEVGLGGWASNISKKMHLLLRVAQVADVNETKATVIHEASHFADASVDDQVYYANAGFFEATEGDKVANAAHYEELPRRDMKTSKFDKKTFTPGVSVSGGALTQEEKVRAAVNLYLRKAWDAGVDVHILIREVRRKYQLGDTKPFKDNEPLIVEISKLMDLTIHEQAAGKRIVTTLDVTVAESVARGVNLIRRIAPSVAFPAPVAAPPGGVAPPALTDIQLRDKMVEEAVKNYGNLLKDAKRDKELLDWLVAHYRGLPDI